MYPDNVSTRQFATDLCAYNGRPLADYLEHDGWLKLSAKKRRMLASYRTLLPRTYELAEKLYSQIPQRTVWGRQIAPTRWITETSGQPIPIGSFGGGSPRTRIGQSLRLQDVLRHLTGHTWAVGTTDLPKSIHDWEAKSGELKLTHNTVPALRIDVDQDDAWGYNDAEKICSELEEQRTIAAVLGLPFRAFRTAGRGFQAVLPLPRHCPQNVASLILEGYLMALEARNSNRAKVDVDNLHRLTRLPGGVHARTGDLGLWIDIDTRCLYPLDQQASLIGHGFRYPKVIEHGLWQVAEFQKAGRDLVILMNDGHISLETVLDRDQVRTILAAYPNNAIIQRAATAIAAGAAMRPRLHVIPARQGQARQCNANNNATIDPRVEPESESHDLNTDHVEETHTSTSTKLPKLYTIEWARQIWDQTYEPGGSWAWINMSGKKGILAATILFGKNSAEQALIDLAERIPVRVPRDLDERRFAIRNLWKTFRGKDYIAMDLAKQQANTIDLGVTSNLIEEFASEVVEKMKLRQPHHRWNAVIAEHTIQALLMLLWDSPTGYIGISYRTLADTFNQKWPGDRVNHMRVKEMVERLSSPGDACLYGLLERFAKPKWTKEPMVYRVGKELRQTPFGQEIEIRMMSYLASEMSEEDHEGGDWERM